MTKHHNQLLLLSIVLLLLAGCNNANDPLQPIKVFNPTPYHIDVPNGFPALFIDENNPITVEGVALGRMLFYDSILDQDRSRACASCHSQPESFTLSGVNSLAHINLGWNTAFLWNGKIEGSLEDIMYFEVAEFFKTDLANLNNHPSYPELFKKAFDVDAITYQEAAYALAQFERTMISGNSKWDKYLRGEASLSQAEAQGYEIFFTEKGDCFHCHGTILFTDGLFHNNGLDLNPQQGREEITGDQNDVGKFKSPTLRNIMLTPPYMHDGRFSTIAEVIDFYSEGLSWSPTIDPLMKKVGQGGVHLNQEEKNHLIAFLMTLTDTTYTTNTALSDPFLK